MQQEATDGDEENARGLNMRQLLLRASRIVNRHVVEGLQARGYAGLRSTHTTLLSNIPLAGGTVSQAAERAGIEHEAGCALLRQGMGRHAARSAGPNDENVVVSDSHDRAA